MLISPTTCPLSPIPTIQSESLYPLIIHWLSTVILPIHNIAHLQKFRYGPPIPSPTPGPIHFDPRLVLRLVLHRALRAQLSIEPGLHQEGDHGHGAHGQLPALPEQGVDQRGDAGGVHAVDVRQPGWAVLGSKGVKVSFWWWKVELLGLRFGDGWFLGGFFLLMVGGLLYQGVIVVLKQTFGSLTLQNIDAPISTYFSASVHRHPPCPILRYPECELFRNSLHTWNALVSHRRPGPGGPGTRRWRRRTCSGGWPWPPPSARPPGRRGACGRSSAAAIPGRWPGASPWSLGGKDKKYIKSMKFAKITRNGWYLDVSTPLLNWRLRV